MRDRGPPALGPICLGVLLGAVGPLACGADDTAALCPGDGCPLDAAAVLDGSVADASQVAPDAAPDALTEVPDTMNADAAPALACSGIDEPSITPGPGLRAVRVGVPTRQLSFQITTIGPVLPDLSLLAVSRGAVGPLADHNVFSFSVPGGQERLLAGVEQYPDHGDNVELGRFGARLALDPTAPARFALLADAGTLCVGAGAACTGEFANKANARLLRLDLESGAMTPVIGRGQLIDAMAVTSHVGSGRIVIADRGRIDLAGDGRLVELVGSALTTLESGLDPVDVVFAPDGTLIVAADARTNKPGLFRRTDAGLRPIVGSANVPVSGQLALHPDGSLYVVNAQKVLRLVDAQGDDVIDEVQIIAEAGVRAVTIGPQGSVFALYGPTGRQGLALLCQ